MNAELDRKNVEEDRARLTPTGHSDFVPNFDIDIRLCVICRGNISDGNTAVVLVLLFLLKSNR
jgi:hypothetical protein